MSRRIAMFAGGAAILLLAVWFLLLWSPKGGELADARERKTAAEQKVKQLQVKLAELSDAQRREPALRAQKDRLAAAVPDQPQLAQFILDANDAAAKARVDFMSITPAPPAPSKVPGQPTVIAISLSVSGDYFKTLDFLDRLSALPRIVVLDGVQLQPAGEEGTKLGATLNGDIFTTEPPAIPGATGATPATGATTPTTTPITTAVK